jgi:raffinose/stachyose/melibiose transport system permease protein
MKRKGADVVTTEPPTALDPVVSSGSTAAGGPRGRKGRRQLQPHGLPWILPGLVLSVGVLYYCIGYTAVISTWDWDGISPDPEQVGLRNYERMFADPVFWGAIRNTIVFFVVTFTVQTALGMLFAVLLHSRVKFGVLYKVIIFIPVVLAPAIMAPVFRLFFAADGQFNWILEHIGLGAFTQPWLGQSSTALWVLMAITIWQWTGLTFVLYYAAMGQIDQSILEAARIDGAGNLRVIWSIIWPGVRGTTVALAMLGAIGALKTFDWPWLVTVAGPNHATEFLGTIIYRQTIPNYHVGYGAAVSILLLVLALVLAIVLQVRGRERTR